MTLCVLCGIPGSGKTTLSKQLTNRYKAKLYCFDNLPGAHSPKRHKAVREQMWHGIAEDLRNGFDVVCDDLHSLTEWRRGLLAAVSGIECKKVLIVMDTPLDECLRRNANREARLPDFVLHDMHKKYQPPELLEGWDEIKEVKTYESNFTSD